MNCLFDVYLIKELKKTHTNLYKQHLHVKIFFKKFLNSIKLLLLFSTNISSTKYQDVQNRVPRCPVPSTEMSHMFSTEMSRSRDVLIPYGKAMINVGEGGGPSQKFPKN